MTTTINQKTLNSVKSTLRLHAKALRIPSGSADIFIKKAEKSALKTLGNRKIITDDDLKRAISRELKKYNPDLAYVYENYDKII